MQERFYVPAFHFNTKKICYCGSGRLFGECCASGQRLRGAPSSIVVIDNFIDAQQRETMIDYASLRPREWLDVADSKGDRQRERVLNRHTNRVTERVDLGSAQQHLQSFKAGISTRSH